ncbi:hypothetical protein EJB05_07523 [Eragrostis curvula]|uniref:SprT-like domain-containing protein n=1 Tax=Eragrostis curvula TaxID=38414 RepID=A0A5J9WJ67_9POAL|nr:hypothetical protein EJB05_07523 [Eragrostis curvula]
MVVSDPNGSGGVPDISQLFCDYNKIYFGSSLDACFVSWAEDPLPDRDVSTCDYYSEGGGCMILLSKSLYECHNDSDLKSVLLHEMIHAYICVKDSNNNHSDHGTKFQKLMNTINLSSVADPHRPADGYSITTHHEIRKKYYDYKCESCGDLVKSIKMSGPSHDSCVEKIGANGLCQNLKCHWHRHKKQCSGSYHKVHELAPRSLELKRSKAEEPLDNGNAAETICKSLHPTSKKSGKSNKGKQEDTSAEFLNLADDAVGYPGLSSSSRNKSNKKIRLSKDVSFDLPTPETVQEIPKRPRTAVLQNQECSRRQKRKLSNWDGTYSSIIQWLGYYSVTDSDEDEVPLINKRTERRKRQKSIETSLAMEFCGFKLATSTSHPVKETSYGCVGSGSQDPGNNSKLAIVPAIRSEERSLHNQVVASHGVAGNQGGHESVSSPLDSPIRGDIIDISD